MTNPTSQWPLEGDQVPKAFCWDYKTLSEQLEARYTDFKQNPEISQNTSET